MITNRIPTATFRMRIRISLRIYILMVVVNIHVMLLGWNFGFTDPIIMTNAIS